MAFQNPFKPASRRKTKLRMALDGTPGAGKTYTALRFAFELGSKVAVIDTEGESASKYEGESPDGKPWKFDVISLTDFSPASYCTLIQSAALAGYDVLIIDSLSHAWAGSGGALEMVDRKASMAKAGANTYFAWRDVTPIHNKMVDAILRTPVHIIATLRTKMEFALEEYTDERGNKKTRPVKIGMKPVQREGVEYEFDIVADLDQSHTLSVSKSRCSAIDGMQALKPGPEFMAPVLHWLNSGADVPAEILEAARLEPIPEPAATKPEEKPQVSAAELAKQRRAKKQAEATEAEARQSTPASEAVAEPIAPAVVQQTTLTVPNGDMETRHTDPCTADQAARLRDLFEALSVPHENQQAILRKRGVAVVRSLTWVQADEIIRNLESKQQTAQAEAVF